MTQIVEMATIKTKAGVTEAQLLDASRVFQKAFLDRQPGFVRRELLRLDDRNYLDLVHWHSRTDADAVMAHVATSEACATYFSMMEMGEDITEGARHYASVEVYGG